MSEKSLKTFQDLLVWLELEQNIFEKNLKSESERSGLLESHIL